jgi:hypothetical protein
MLIVNVHIGNCKIVNHFISPIAFDTSAML